MPQSRILTLIAAALLVAWVVFAFVRPIASGWVHVPLVVAVLLIVRAIVAADDERAGRA